MGADAVLVGEIAHIEGALPDSARFNSMMSNEQRRGYDNLLLLCATHHTVIDRDAKQWTVARLKDLKHKHEAIYTAAVDQLRRQVGDITEGVTYTPANNGRVLLDQHGLDDHERAESCMDINRFAERLSKIPADARSLLSLIVIRGDKVPDHVAMGGRFRRWSTSTCCAATTSHSTARRCTSSVTRPKGWVGRSCKTWPVQTARPSAASYATSISVHSTVSRPVNARP